MQFLIGILAVLSSAGVLIYMGKSGYSWDSKKNKMK